MRRPLALVLGVNLLIGAAVHAIRPIVSYRVLDLGGGPVELGAIAASYGLISLAIAVFVGRWVDRWGASRFMIAGSVGVGCVALFLMIADSLAALAVAMAMLGLSQILMVVSVQTFIAKDGEGRRRDTRFGWQSVAASLGQLVGPLSAGFIATVPAGTGHLPPLASIRLVFMAAAGVAVVALILGIATIDRSRVRVPRSSVASVVGRQRSMAVRQVLGLPSMPQAMFASLAVLSSVDLLVVYLPAFALATGIQVETVGLLLATRAAASIFSRVLILPLRTLFGRRQLLAAALLMPAIALSVFPIAAPSLPIMFVLIGVAGFGLGLGQPLTVSWVAARAPIEVRGMAIGLRLSGNRLGQLVVPAAVGVAAGAIGLAGVFWSVGGMLAAGVILVMSSPFSEPSEGDSNETTK
jgi:MFS family permease